jgi:hypothetical protein
MKRIPMKPAQPRAMLRKPGRALLIYLSVLAAIGVMMLGLATKAMGPGVSTDSAVIMSTAENLMRGKGLIDYMGRELTQFPPLYSIGLAAGALIFKADVFVVGWMLNGLVFALLIAGTGLYLAEAFGEEPLLAYLGSFVVLSSTSLLQIAANVASDPVFMLMVLAFMMAASAYLRTGDVRYAIMAASITVVSCFQRYAGLALVITGGVIALYAHRSNLRRALVAAGAFVLITATPIYAWGYLHNRPYNGTVFGGRLPPVAEVNLAAGAEKLLYWFIPHRLISAVGDLPLLAILVGLCVLGILLTGARRFLARLQRPPVVASVAFLIVYGAVLVFNISSYELRGIGTDRVHIVVLPALLVLMGAMGDQWLEAAGRRLGPARLRSAIVVIFLIWAIYPVSKSADYVREAMARGDVSSYNSINKAHIGDSSLARFLTELDLHGKQLYSNGGDTVWFIMRTQVQAGPILESNDRLLELRQRFAGWPTAEGEGYLIWLKAEAHKTKYATPEELGQIADIMKLFDDESGSVYSVRVR